MSTTGTPDLSRALVPLPGQESYVRKRFWHKVRRTLRLVPFLDKVIAAYYAAIDPATPRSAQLVLMAALAYFVMPFDIVPDIVAIFGFGDDAAVMLLAMNTLSPHITPAHMERARAYLAAEQAKADNEDSTSHG
ncbi:MAG: DUF1232 domain-containing protein [Rhodospirillales bacterium]|nr:DUF1232 domain-containing protein [Rhodospirillales bacterium]